MPAHIAAAMADPNNSNIADKASTPTLSPAGQKWTIILNGEKTPMVRRNSEGDEEPVQVFRATVLDYAKSRGRSYYGGAYNPDEIKAPDCWSNDGKLPDASIKMPQSKKCEGCPMSKKGSKISENNKATVACSSHLMLAVVPASKLDFTPLRLKLAITSIWDKDGTEEQAKGWYAWDQYVDFLRSRNVKNTGMLVTKIKFDLATDYPKMLFSAAGWFDTEQSAKIIDLQKSDDVKQLLSRAWAAKAPEDAPAAPAEELEEKAGPAPTPAKQKAQTAPPTPPQAAVDDDDDDGTTVIPPSTPAPKADAAKPTQVDPKRAAAIAAAKAKAALAQAQLEAAAAEAAAAEAEAGETEAEVVETPAPTKKADAAKPAKANTKPTAAPSTPAVPASVAGLLDTWGDE